MLVTLLKNENVFLLFQQTTVNSLFSVEEISLYFPSDETNRSLPSSYTGFSDLVMLFI